MHASLPMPSPRTYAIDNAANPGPIGVSKPSIGAIELKPPRTAGATQAPCCTSIASELPFGEVRAIGRDRPHRTSVLVLSCCVPGRKRHDITESLTPPCALDIAEMNPAQRAMRAL